MCLQDVPSLRALGLEGPHAISAFPAPRPSPPTASPNDGSARLYSVTDVC